MGVPLPQAGSIRCSLWAGTDLSQRLRHSDPVALEVTAEGHARLRMVKKMFYAILAKYRADYAAWWSSQNAPAQNNLPQEGQQVPIQTMTSEETEFCPYSTNKLPDTLFRQLTAYPKLYAFLRHIYCLRSVHVPILKVQTVAPSEYATMLSESTSCSSRAQDPVLCCRDQLSDRLINRLNGELLPLFEDNVFWQREGLVSPGQIPDVWNHVLVPINPNSLMAVTQEACSHDTLSLIAQQTPWLLLGL